MKDVDDATLAAHVRAGDERAVAELYARLMPLLLHEARRLGVQPGLRREVAADVVRVLYFALVHPDRPAPRSLAAYAVRMLHRYRWLLRRVERSAADSLDADGGAPVPAPAEPEASDAPSTLPPLDDAWLGAGSAAELRRSPLERLAAALAARLTAEERELLGWMADHVPQRTIAEWRGVPYEAMRKRIFRVREKARQIAESWIRGRPPDEQAWLLRHLARTPAGDRPRARPRPITHSLDRGAHDDAR